MRSGNLARQIVVVVLLLFYFQPSSSAVQQVPGASPSAQAAGQAPASGGHDVVDGVKWLISRFHRNAVAPKREKSAVAANAGAQTETPAPPEKPAAGASQPVDDNVPSLPGATVRVLKEGEKIPERKNPDYEDWRRPELPHGMKLEAIPLGTAQGPGFTRKLVHVQWREMDPIDLWLIKPAGVTNPPVILYLYSYDGSNQRYKNDDFCKFLTQGGFAAVGFVSALTEQRFHDRPMIESFVSQLEEALGTTTHDVQMILNYLGKRGDLDMSRVGIWADGSGAGIAIMASAVDARIKTLDLLDPWGDWPDWVAKSALVPENRRAEFLGPLYQSEVADLDPLQYFPKVKAQKIRLQYIKDGISVTPAVVMEKMEAAAPSNADIVHYENMNEFLTKVAEKGNGFDWIKANLSLSSPQSESRDRADAPLERKDSTPQ
jgi:hypothetical protein